MDKEEFISSTAAPRSVAGRAWEMADGESGQAEKLVEPVELQANVKFRDSGDRFGGLLSIFWDFVENDVKEVEAIVSTSDKVLDIPVDCPPEEFYRRLTNSKQTGEKMGGNTETLQVALEKELKSVGTSLRECVSSANLQQLDDELLSILVNNLDVSQPQLATEVQIKRRLDHQPEGEEAGPATEEESSEHVFPVEVEIDPVRGVPVNQISIGDLIYVDLGDYSPQLQKIAQVLEQRRDESGLIPAQLTSSEISEAGTLSLRVQFGRDVYGKARCGKDVNILVPESTAADKSQGMSGSEGDPLEYLAENWVFIVPFGGALIIIIVVVIILSL